MYDYYDGEPIEHTKKRYEYELRRATSLDGIRVTVMFICQDYISGKLNKSDLNYYIRLLKKQLPFLERLGVKSLFRKNIRKYSR